MKFPTVQELGEKVANSALDEFIYKGKTLREWIDKISEQDEHKGSYECFHCLSKSVCWDGDFDFSDYGYEGEGIVQVCHCANCGAEIEYRISIPNEEEDEKDG